MATDADIVPETVTDFVFDLYDSVTLSQLTEEQSRLYNSVFRDLSSKVRVMHDVMCREPPSSIPLTVVVVVVSLTHIILF